MKALTLVLLLQAVIALADGEKADTLTTSKGKVYNDVTVMKVQPDGLKVSHSAGVVKIPFEELPEAVQKRFQFDPGKAKAFRAESSVKEAAAREQLALADTEEKLRASVEKYAKEYAVQLSGRVLQVIGEGVLLTDATIRSGTWGEELPDGAAMLHCSPGDLVNGSGVQAEAYLMGNYRYTTLQGTSRLVKEFTTSKEELLQAMRKRAGLAAK